MADLLKIYKCEMCGNIIEVLHSGAGDLVCCGENMKLINENTVDAAVEKHVPVVESLDGPTRVKVGSVAHPMEEDHYIEWIEIKNDAYTNRKFLKPGDTPQADFYVKFKEGMAAKAYCNKHGLWKK